MTEHTLSDQVAAAVAPDASRVQQVDAQTITIDGRRYAIVADYRTAFDATRLAERYNDVLAKYDYIVGDWGYDQLRLRGFYATGNRRASRDQLITTLQDYLYEYCNFGCAYFVLQRLEAPAPRPPRRRPRKTERQVKAVKPSGQATTVHPDRPNKRRFQIHTRTQGVKH